MNADKFQLSAEWAPDCQGKQDFDCEICVLSTRYWPRGGGFAILENGVFSTNSRLDIKPSAHATIGLRLPDTDIYELIDQNFEAETEQDVKLQVEAWAETNYRRVVACLLKEFGKLGE